jgi:hypothetical protein
MDEILARFWDDLIGRTTGPLTFRFILQPLMAVLYAYRDGRSDARAGRPPYFWTILTEPGERGALLHQGWAAMARVIGLGVVMDVIYQLTVLGRLYPGELIVIVLLLAFVPYLLLRGPFNRLMRRRVHA